MLFVIGDAQTIFDSQLVGMFMICFQYLFNKSHMLQYFIYCCYKLEKFGEISQGRHLVISEST